MQTMQSQKREFELPNGYGDLVEILDVSGVEGLGGHLYVHSREDGVGLVATLQLNVGTARRTFRFLGEPKTPKVTDRGSQLLFRNLPTKDREDFESPSFKARQVSVYEGKRGPFAMTPFGLVPLRRRDPNAPLQPQTFDLAGFRDSAVALRAQMQNQQPRAQGVAAPPTGPSDGAVELVVSTIKSLDGPTGAAWDAVLAKVGEQNVSQIEAEMALDLAMQRGVVYEPTLGILKSA